MESLIKVRIDGEEAVVHTEFQTTTDPTMPIRMAGYIVRAIEMYGLPVYSTVVYLRPNAGRNDPGHYIQDLPGHRVVIEYNVIRLSEVEGQAILDSEQVGLYPFASLMKRPEGTDSEAWFQQCIDATRALRLEESKKVDILSGLAIVSGLEYESTLINRILSQEGLMDAIMRESSFAQYIKQQGIEQGIQESIQEVLEIRFDLTPSHPIADRIAAIDDLQRLKQLRRSALQVSSLEAFEQALDALDLTRFGGYLMSNQKGDPLCHQPVPLTQPS